MHYRNKVLHPKRESDAKQTHQSEVTILGKAVLVTLAIVLLQSIIVWKFIASTTLKGDTFHAASDLFVNVGAFAVAFIASRGYKHHENLRRWFSYIGIALLVVGGVWVAIEAYVRLWFAPVRLMNEWLMVTGIVGGMGNFWVHRIIDRMPKEDRTHTHEILDAHVLSDMALSMVVVLAGALGYFFGWYRADPILSILVGAWMLSLAKTLVSMRGQDCDHNH